MKDKYKKAIKKSKKTFRILIIFWILITILFICPLAKAIVDANAKQGGERIDIFFNSLLTSIIKLNSFIYMFSAKYFGTFLKVFFNYSILFCLFSAIGIYKSAPKSEYEKIEHGSSDWSGNGEQYKILNENEGIILAKDNYLPLTKRGNLNMLIVGRIW